MDYVGFIAQSVIDIVAFMGLHVLHSSWIKCKNKDAGIYTVRLVPYLLYFSFNYRF